jgi:hypothetical protein
VLGSCSKQCLKELYDLEAKNIYALFFHKFSSSAGIHWLYHLLARRTNDSFTNLYALLC